MIATASAKRSPIRHRLLLALAILGAFGLSSSPAPKPDERLALLPGAPVEGALGAGEVRTFEVELAAGGAWRVSAEQRGIDCILSLLSPQGEILIAVDSPLDRWGTEEILWRPPSSGRYLVEVRSAALGVAAGSFQLRLEKAAEETGADRERLSALFALTRADEAWHGQASAGREEGLQPVLADLESARGHFEAAGDAGGQAEALAALAAVSRRLGRLKEAEALLSDLATRWHDLQRPDREVRAFCDLGLTRWDLGKLQEAGAALAQGLALVHSLGDRFSEADLTNDRSLVQHAGGGIRDALPGYRESLAIFEQLGERGSQADVLNNLGYAHFQLGEPVPAEARYSEALKLRREIGDRRGEAQSLNNLAVLYRTLGETDRALAAYGEQREILAGLSGPGDRRQQAAALNNLGVLYGSLGEVERARLYLDQALALRHQVEDRRGEIATLNNLGLLERDRGEPAAALGFYRRARELAASIADRRTEAISASLLGEALAQLKRWREATDAVDQALAIQGEIGDRPRRGFSLCQSGEIRIALGEPEKALPPLEEALVLVRAVGDRANEVRIETARAHAFLNLGRLDAARVEAEAALDLLEGMRRELAAPELRASFLGTQQAAFEVAIDILMRLDEARPGLGFDRLAFETSERARARSLLDLVERGGLAESRDAESATRRRDLDRELALKTGRRQQLLAAAHPDLGQVKELERGIEQATAELDRLAAEEASKSPRRAALNRGAAAPTAEIQALLGSDTLLLEIALGRERSTLWLLGESSLQAFALPPRREIEPAARALYAALAAPSRDGGTEVARLQAELGAMLLGPVAGRLGAHRLAVVADGALDVLPFDLLSVSDASPATAANPQAVPLLRDHEVVELPSASVLVALRREWVGRPAAPRLGIVLADPVFGPEDSRLAGAARARSPGSGPESRGAAPLGRLGFSHEEAEAITAAAPAGSILVKQGFAASRDALVGGPLRDFRTLHLATHGIFDTARPELSGLVLSRVDPSGRPLDGFVGLRDIYGLDLAADLVVLSGCQTALGREIRGEGLLGLTRGFFYAGAPRVVASLWRVDDRATARLMARFYHGLWGEGQTAAAALRQARLGLAAEHRYRDPYYWGAFILQGDWR